MRNRLGRQAGITLVVSLIMLVVLTLLVVSAVRFGNINLKVASNAQIDMESQAAAQIEIEQLVVTLANPAVQMDQIAAITNAPISTGATSYNVSVAKPKCITTRYVMNTELNRNDATDQRCFSEGAQTGVFDANGKPIPQPTQCLSQTWEVTATLADPGGSGQSLSLVQGVSARVGPQTPC